MYFLVARIRSHGFDWRLFASTLTGLNWNWLAAGMATALSAYYVRALRWAVLLKPVSPHPSLWNLFSATAIGFTAITLLGRPGEFVRPYLIAVKERVPFSSQLAAWFLERIFDLLIALLVFGFALARVQSSDVSAGPQLRWVLQFGGRFVGALSFICLAVLVLFRHFSQAMRQRLLDGLGFLPPHYFKRVEGLVDAFVQGMESTQNTVALALLVAYTLLEWVLIAGCYYCLARSYGSVVQLSWIDILIFMGFVSFGAVVQIPGIGGGPQLVTIVVLTQLFGSSLEVATSFAFVLWITMFVVIVPFGLLLAFHEGLNWQKLRQIGREAGP